MHKLISFLVLISLSSLFALTGVVQDDQGAPLEDVFVYLSVQDTSVRTDASGRFVIDVITPITAPNPQVSQSVVTYAQGKMTFNSVTTNPIKMFITNARGQVVFTKSFIAAQGVQSLNIPRLSPGIYLFQAEIGSERVVQKFVPSQQFSVGAELSVPSQRRARASSEIDRLFLERDGFNDTSLQVLSYSDSYSAIALRPSSVLTPSQADGTWLLVYEKQLIGDMERSFSYTIDRANTALEISGDTVITHAFGYDGIMGAPDTTVYSPGDLLGDKWIDVTVSGDTLKLYEGCQFGEAVHTYVWYTGAINALQWEGRAPITVDPNLIGKWYSSMEIQGGHFSDTRDTIAVYDDTLAQTPTVATSELGLELTADSLIIATSEGDVYRFSVSEEYETYKNMFFHNGELFYIYEFQFGFWGNGIKAEYWYLEMEPIIGVFPPAEWSAGP